MANLLKFILQISPMNALNLLLHLLGFPDVTHLLARIWGVILLTFFLGILCNRSKLKTFVRDIDSQYVAVVLGGIIALVFGVICAIFHSVWEKDWAISITLLGWACFAFGFLAVIYPQYIALLVKKISALPSLVISAVSIACVCLGALLIYKGLEDTREETPPKPLPPEISSLESRESDSASN